MQSREEQLAERLAWSPEGTAELLRQARHPDPEFPYRRAGERLITQLRLLPALEQLSEPQREVVNMVFGEGRNFADIADELHQDRSAPRQKLVAAVSLLRQAAGIERRENAGNLSELRMQLQLSRSETLQLMSWAQGTVPSERLVGRPQTIAERAGKFSAARQRVLKGFYFENRSGAELAKELGTSGSIVANGRLECVGALRRALDLSPDPNGMVEVKWAAALLATPEEARLLITNPSELIARSLVAADLNTSDHDIAIAVSAALTDRERAVLVDTATGENDVLLRAYGVDLDRVRAVREATIATVRRTYATVSAGLEHDAAVDPAILSPERDGFDPVASVDEAAVPGDTEPGRVQELDRLVESAADDNSLRATRPGIGPSAGQP